MKKFYAIKDVTSGRYLSKEEGRNYINWTSFASDSNRYESKELAEKFIKDNPNERGFFEVVEIVTNSAN
jgi:hypothetical protein